MKRAWILSLCAAFCASCSVWLDPDRSQCASNADCRRFSGSSCDVRHGVCVATRSEVTGSGTPGSTPSPSGALAASPAACARKDKPLVRIEGDITSDDRLTCAYDYLLVGNVFVKGGVTLTVDAGTTVHGDLASRAVLVVQPGARLVAQGAPDAPIVFTSAAPAGARAAGDWGGVILLGRAPVNAESPEIEGITEGGAYGGADPDDDSGILTYVRIEYSGTKLGPNNEVNGLTLGGVGRRTKIDYVLIRHTADDCFELFGGTVNAQHLVCHHNGDDGFDWDLGYQGKLQFLVLQQDPSVADETNGVEGDNDATGSARTPQSEPTIYNATLVGKNLDVDKEQYGLLLRRSTKAHVFNAVVVGFEAALDVRDVGTQVQIGNSVFFGNVTRPLAYEEDGSNAGVQKNDDGGFDEVKQILDPAAMNATADPNLGAPFDLRTPDFAPAAALTANAAAPPDDGFFDSTAAFVGAFRDRTDRWLDGAWAAWAQP